MVDIYGGTSTGGLANLNNTLVRLAQQNRNAPYEAEKLNAMKRTGELAGMNLEQEKKRQQGLTEVQNMKPEENESPEAFTWRQMEKMNQYDPAAVSSKVGLMKLQQDQKNEIHKNMLSIMKQYSGNEVATKQALKLMYPEKSKEIEMMDFGTKFGDNTIASPVYDKQGQILGNWVTSPTGETTFKDYKSKEKWSKPYKSKVGGKEILLKENLDTGETVQVSQDATTGINSILPEDQLVGSAHSIAMGKMDPISFLSKRGTQLYAIQQEVRNNYPNFDFNKANANYKYMINPTNLNAIGRVAAAMPRVEDLKGKIDKIKNSVGTPLLDKPLNYIKRSVGGNVAIVDFESLRNAILTEVNTALSGSSVASDFRIKLELENLSSDRTPKQLHAAVNNLISALEARTDASLAVPFPWDQVRGESKQEIQKPSVGPSKKSRFIVEEVK